MAQGEKLDLYKLHKDEYRATKTPALVEVGPAQYLTITGQGDPSSPAFTDAVGAMYSAAFTIKMTRKFAGLDYKVASLEGLWWVHGDQRDMDFLSLPREQWRWKLLIRVPPVITAQDLQQALDGLRKKKKENADLVAQVALETLHEGLCVQILHVGPYADEPRSLALMAELVRAKGLSHHGTHHELYLSDPRRVTPEKLRTILRHPVR